MLKKDNIFLKKTHLEAKKDKTLVNQGQKPKWAISEKTFDYMNKVRTFKINPNLSSSVSNISINQDILFPHTIYSSISISQSNI